MSEPAAAAGGNVLTKLDERAPTAFYWQLTLLATLGGFLFGYDTSNIGSALNFVPYNLKGAVGDYFVNHLLNPQGLPAGQVRNPALQTQDALQPIANILDGTSNTTIIHEQAGRPDYYLRGPAKQPTNAGLNLPMWWGPWASWQHFQYQGYTADGRALGTACAVNCSNSQGIFAFHPGGAHVAFCDGGVRFLRDTVAVPVAFALATRDGGEVLSADQY